MAAVAGLVAVFAACEDDSAGGGRGGVEVGGSGVSVAELGDGDGWAVQVGGVTLLESAAGKAAVVRSVADSAESLFGSFYFEEREIARVEASGATVQGGEGAGATVSLGSSIAAIRFEPLTDGVVRGRVTAEPQGLQELQGLQGPQEPQGGDGAMARPVLRFACRDGGRFAGLGAQVDGFDHRGEIVPLWVAEQGNGKKVGATRQDFPMGDVHDSYFPVPWVFDPAGGWGILIEGTARTVLDLCATDPDAFAIEVRSSRWSFLLVTGDSPLQLIERMTAQTGRQSLPNPWALGVWTDAVRGQQAVLEHARALRAAGAPVSAIWSEDWAGNRENRLTGFGLTYHWDTDEALYPDLPGMIDELESMGFAFLGYFNTFLQEDSTQWEQGLADGHAATRESGEPYVFTAPSLRNATLVDVTRPQTRQWMGRYMRAAADLGIRGWMADFAEWLPTDSVVDAGDGWEAHNDYPRQWASLNREILETAYPDGDWIFFSRSGWTGSWTSSPVIWGGDQNTDWEALDGMPSALALGVNLGASGVPFYASDIGGYASLGDVEHRTKELWQRWTEMAAWSPLMRTHHGHGAAANWQLIATEQTESDAQTLEHFVRFAKLHQSLLPYLQGLAAQAESRGWPLIRGCFLHHPEHDGAWRSDQYLLGEHVLVAPIIKPGADRRQVWLPPGRWTRWDGDGARLDGPGEVEAIAAIGAIPVFLREGAVIPTLATPPDTLVGWQSEGVTGLTADAELLVHHVAGAPGSFTLADGTVLTPGQAPTGRPVSWKSR